MPRQSCCCLRAGGYFSPSLPPLSSTSNSRINSCELTRSWGEALFDPPPRAKGLDPKKFAHSSSAPHSLPPHRHGYSSHTAFLAACGPGVDRAGPDAVQLVHAGREPWLARATQAFVLRARVNSRSSSVLALQGVTPGCPRPGSLMVLAPVFSPRSRPHNASPCNLQPTCAEVCDTATSRRVPSTIAVEDFSPSPFALGLIRLQPRGRYAFPFHRCVCQRFL